MNKIRQFLKSLGPGFITGAADDDPSGIATYSQTGAQFGYGQLWLAVFMLPFQTAIQEACARIGAVTGKGIAAVVKENYNSSLLYGILFLLLIANIINIGADIGAMAAAANLIVPINFYALVIFFSTLMLVTEIFLGYKAYAKILKWLGLTLLAYPITVFLIQAPWLKILYATFIPHIEFNFQFLFIITGVLGTTISPYLFFWQASQVVEERQENHAGITSKNTIEKKNWIWSVRLDNFIGMLFSQIATWSIIVVAATVLHSNGILEIKTAADAAKALEPFVHGFANAGYLSKVIFAVGIIGLGLLAVPILASSAAYAIGEALGLKIGLNLAFKKAIGFYGIIILATLLGMCLNFLDIDPMRALVYSAVLNGIVAVPLIYIIIMITNNKKIMGTYKSSMLSQVFLWMTFGGMFIAVLSMLILYKNS